MTKSLFPLLVLALAFGGLAGCQPTPPTTGPATGVAPTAPAASSAVGTAAAARAAVARHIGALPKAALFVPDSARVSDNGTSWQVLVPRTDWAGRMPNRARFEVDKQTGRVSSQPVK